MSLPDYRSDIWTREGITEDIALYLKTVRNSKELTSLIDPYTKKTGLDIIKEVVFNPKLKRVIFLGEPGSGKTLLLKYLINIADTAEPITGRKMIPWWYDEPYAKYSKDQLDPRDPPNHIRDLIVEDLINADKSYGQNNVLRGYEVPVWGDLNKNRGLSLIKYCANQNPEETMYIAIAASEAIGKEVAEAREKILTINSYHECMSTLREENGIFYFVPQQLESVVKENWFLIQEHYDKKADKTDMGIMREEFDLELNKFFPPTSRKPREEKIMEFSRLFLVNTQGVPDNQLFTPYNEYLPKRQRMIDLPESIYEIAREEGIVF